MTASQPIPRSAVVIDDNLMFAPRVEASLRRLGFEVWSFPPRGDVAASVAELAPDLVLVNLASAGPAALDLVRSLRARPELARCALLAYHNHTDSPAFHAAKEAGADQVVANSAVANHLEAVLRASGVIDSSPPSS